MSNIDGVSVPTVPGPGAGTATAFALPHFAAELSQQSVFKVGLGPGGGHFLLPGNAFQFLLGERGDLFTPTRVRVFDTSTRTS